MIALPPDIPAFEGPRAMEVYQCARKASKYYNLNPFINQTILKIEGGKIGTISHNTDGSYDYGVMQVNTVWIDEIMRMQKIKINIHALTQDPCYNIHIGTWILALKIKDANGDVWKGIGNYHSKTPSKHYAYLRKAVVAYTSIYDHWDKEYKKAQRK